MKRLLKPLTPIIKPLILKYLATKRRYSYKGIRTVIYPGVFHPGLFFSTKLLIEFLSTLNLKDVKVLELGAGSGLIAIYCALRKQAIVTASDISPLAIQNITENVLLNDVKIEIVQSDLFDDLNPADFQIIIINPPYFPKDPIDDKEKAWYCGANFDYFKKLFSQLNIKCSSSLTIYMILSEDCDIRQIESIANENSLTMELNAEIKLFWETNFVYKIFRNYTPTKQSHASLDF